MKILTMEAITVMNRAFLLLLLWMLKNGHVDAAITQIEEALNRS